MAAKKKEKEGDDYTKYLKYKNEAKLMSFGDKNFVWVPASGGSHEGFLSAEVLNEDGDWVNVKTAGGEQQKHRKKDVHPQNPPRFDGVEDCAELSNLNEPAVFHNLRKRYEEDLIYTYSGLFCVVINPYKRIPIYTPQMVDLYRGRRRNELAPHVFAVADGAYRNMIKDRENQSMLITGESGAGKTENTKKVIQYLATIAGRVSGDEIGTLEQQILEANPVLEAFGNAKTLKNDNSSRFGKFIRVMFNQGGVICGANIESYLLERSRVVFQAKGERSFHIFYQLLQGASLDDRKKYHLAAPETFKYLSGSGCVTVSGLDDRKEFEATLAAMALIGFTDVEKDTIFRVVSGILHLSNLPFGGGAGDSTILKDKRELGIIAQLLKANPDQLENALLRPRIKAGTEIVVKQLNPEQASNARDALCKAIYGRMFLWIVKRINDSINKGSQAHFIGVLDIAGFEIFENNSFEQMCINYTNERLQQFFNHHMFKLEQEEYAREQINWTFIDFGMDSQDTIDLIDKRPTGILALLEEECFFPKGSDESFLAKINAAHARNARFKKPKFQKGTFRLAHYAGEVEYTVLGWLDKNKDPLQDDLVLSMKQSKDPQIVALFGEEFSYKTKKEAAEEKAGGSTSGTAKKGATFFTVSNQYKEQLGDLMDTLYATHPHFVRCIIPNHKKMAGHLDADIVLDQLKCNGVLEGIRISRKGFPNRLVYAEFMRRYYLLHPKGGKEHPDPRKSTEELLKNLAIDPEQYRFGLTKIFFRAGTLAKVEEARERKIGDYFITIQGAARGYLGRRLFRRLKNQQHAAKIIQKNVRTWKQFQSWGWWGLMIKAKPILKTRTKETALSEQEALRKAAEDGYNKELQTIQKLNTDMSSTNTTLEKVKDDLAAERSRVQSLRELREQLENARLDNSKKFDDLTKALSSDKTESKDLQGDVKTAEREAEEAASNLDKETKARKALEETKAQNEQRIEQLEKDLEASGQAIDKLERQKTLLEREVEDIREQLQSETDQAAMLEKQRRSLQGAAEELKEQIDDANKESRKLKSDISKLETDLGATKEDLAQETTSKDSAIQNNKTRALELEDLRDRIEKGEKDIFSTEKLKGKLSSEISDIRSRLDAEKADSADLTKRNTKLQSDVKDTEAKLADEQKNRNALDDAKRTLDSNVEDLRRQLENAKAKLNSLEKTKASLEKQIQDLNDELNSEGELKGNVQKAIKKVESELEEARAACEDEKRAKEDLQKRSQRMEGEIKELKNSLESEKRAREASTKKKNETEETVRAARESADLSLKAQNLERQKKAIDTELTDAKDKLKDLEDAKAKLDKGRKEIEKEVDSIKLSIAEVEEKIDEADQGRAKLDAEARSVKALLDGLSDAGKGEAALGQVKTELEDLKDQLDLEEQQSLAIERAKRKIDADLDDAKKSIEIENEEKFKLERQKRTLEDVLKELRGQLSTEALAASEKASSYKRLELELQDTKDQLDLIMQQKSALEKARRNLQQTLDDVKGSIDDANDSKKSFENNKKDLEKQLADLKDQLEGAGRQEVEDFRIKCLGEVEEWKRKIQYETDAKDKSESSKKDMTQELADVKEILETEQKQRIAADRTRRKIEANLDDMYAQLETEKIERQKYDDQTKKFDEDMRRIKTDLGAGGKAGGDSEVVSRLEDEIKDSKAQLGHAQKAMESIERQRVSLTEELENLKNEVDDEARLASRAAANKGRIEDEIKELTQSLEEEEEAKDTLAQAKRKTEIDIEELKKQLDIALEAKKRAEDQTSGVQTQYEKVKKTLEDDRKAKFDADRLKKKMEIELEELNSRLESEAKARTKAETAKKTADKGLKEFQRKLLDGEQATVRAEKEALKALEAYEGFKGKVDLTLQERDEVEDQKRNLEAQLDGLKEELDTEKRARLRIDSAKKDLENEVKELQSQIEENESGKSNIDNLRRRETQEVDKLKAQLDRELELRKRHEDAKSSAEKEAGDLKAELDNAQGDALSLEKDRLSVEDEITTFQRRLEEEQKSRDKVDKEARRLEKEAREVRKQAQDAGRGKNSEANQLAKLEAEVKRLRTRNDEEEARRNEVIDFKIALERQVNEVKDRIRDVETDISKARENLESEVSSRDSLNVKLNQVLKTIHNK